MMNSEDAAELEASEDAIEAEITAIDRGRFPTFADDSHRPLPREWNWENRLPRGKVVLICGWRECGSGRLPGRRRRDDGPADAR
jgi:hypothetical protein